MIFLFLLSLVPLPTQALGQDFLLKNSHVFYASVLTAVSFVFCLLQIESNQYIRYLSHTEIRFINRKNWIATILYALAIPLSQISIFLSTFVFILMPVLYFIPSAKLSMEEEKQPWGENHIIFWGAGRRLQLHVRNGLYGTRRKMVYWQRVRNGKGKRFPFRPDHKDFRFYQGFQNPLPPSLNHCCLL